MRFGYRINYGKNMDKNLKTQTSIVVHWSEFLPTDHEVPSSIPDSNMGNFSLKGKISMLTMVWVV
jgi:hypothetical protein